MAKFTDIPYPAADDDAANKKYVDDHSGGGGGSGLPAGGTTGQQLTKHSGTDFDVEWAPSGGTGGGNLPIGGATGQQLTKVSGTDFDVNWAAPGGGGGGGSGGVPLGGSTGQQLTKRSNTDFDVNWAAPGGTGGGGAGFQGVNHQTGTSYSVLAIDDKNKLITLNNASPVSVILPSIGLADNYDVAAINYQFDDLLCVDPTNGVAGVGQSFTANVGGAITKARFFLKRIGSPTGNAVAKLYAHTGTYGTLSVPGALLATSNNLNVTTVSATGAYADLTFTGGYRMVAGTHYIITIEYAGPDTSNCITPADTLVLGHSGQELELNGTASSGKWVRIGSPSSWITASAATDLITTPIPHGLNAGDWVMLYDAIAGGPNIPLPLYDTAQYFVSPSGLTTTSFKVSYTNGGSPINLTTDAGVNAVWALKLAAEPEEDLIFYIYTDATSLDDTWIAYFENLGTGLVTISAADTTIDEGTTIPLRQDTGVIIACDGSAYYTCRGVGLGTEKLPITSMVTGANFTTTSLSVVDITGLTFAAKANHVYEVECLLKVQSTGSLGIQIGTNYSAAGATGAMVTLGNSNQIAAAVGGGVMANTTTEAFSYAIAANLDCTIWLKGVLTTGVNAGNITTTIKKITSGTGTVYIGSWMKVTLLI